MFHSLSTKTEAIMVEFDFNIVCFYEIWRPV